MSNPSARASVGELVALIVAEDGRPRMLWAIELGLVAAANVLVLHSLDVGLRAEAGAGAPVAAILTLGLAVFVNQSLCGDLSRRVLASLSTSVSRTSGRILAGTSRLDLERFEALGGPEIMARVTDDAGRIVPGGNLIVQTLVAVGTVALSLLYVAGISMQAAVVSGVAVFATALLMRRLETSVMAQVVRDQAAGRRMREPIHDLLAGFKQLKQHQARSAAIAAAFDREASALKRSHDVHYEEFYARETLSRQAYIGLLGVVGFVIPVVAPSVSTDVSRLLVAVTFSFRPVVMILMAVPLLTRLGATWQRMTDLADHLADQVDASASVLQVAPLEPPRPFSQIMLRGVTYQYAPQDDRTGFTVGPCDFEISPGEVVFLTGANGSGKSTFVKLLCGLYPRHSGELLVDGEPLPMDPGPAWRSQFSTVFAEPALFERLYGLEDVDPARVTALLEQMELGHKVRFEAGHFSTIELSTGQRKRLALVVALLAERPIYVFDEWAADQDPHFREAFYRQILPSLRARGKAVVAVTHDDDAFDVCDRRLHFDRGQVGLA